MNPLDALREKLEAGFICASYADPSIKDELGIRQMSQIWIDVPAWYFWLKDLPGAFMLEALEGRTLQPFKDEASGALSVLSAVRYFPHPDEKNFGAFSPGEQSLRTSALFDATGTPRFEEIGTARNSFFHIANLECIFDRGNAWTAFLLDAPLLLNSALTGGAERSVPAWEISAALFDTMIRMFTYYLRRPPLAHADALIGKGSEKLALALFSDTNRPGLMESLAAYTGVKIGGEVKNEWKQIARIEPRSHLTSLCGCKDCS
jgi:hypothetical protein